MLSITDFEANLWTVVCLFVLPCVCVGAGALNLLLRRRRGAREAGGSRERFEKGRDKREGEKKEEKAATQVVSLSFPLEEGRGTFVK